ncbi:MAG: NUDIX hydrolase [Phycisphaerales bacterium]|nr:NUDIX hydrolase [Phycisphaerales bacterium]MCB9856337.1 NUDIX hydrolase [Phycisphaerales bacterium]MCB9864009.1 NUDIX hydrolase [Phycisphaerales bacterium]
MSHTYDYPRPMVTVDCVVFGLDADRLQVLLIRRKSDPFKDRWALPGGFVDMDEALEDAARRELTEETGLKDIFLEQLFTFGDPDRDPRGRSISVAYYGLVSMRRHTPEAASDASEVVWKDATSVRRLAFDHDTILNVALERLRAKVRYKPIGFELLPRKFTLSQLQKLYEVILERPLDKRNFRRKILGMDLLVELDEKQQDVSHRAARLYRFDQRKYQRLEKAGFNFEL